MSELPRRKRALAAWSTGMVVSWLIGWAIYAEVYGLDNCFLGTGHGGRARSQGWAVLIGLILLAVAAVLAFRWRRRLVALFAAFVVFYATGLIVLWVLSPAIWGSVHCTGGSF